jgi:molybdenum cofactor sulfurtransferase
MQTSPSTDAYGLFSGMDISPQILEAVQKMDTETPPRRMKSTSSLRKHTPRRTPRYPGHLTTTANSSAEDVSTTSDSDRDHDYHTDFTTPATSDIYPEDMQPDDVEDFRDREYPQLKGKTYLDHGGTTVCQTLPTCLVMHVGIERGTDMFCAHCSSTRNLLSRNSLPT